MLGSLLDRFGPFEPGTVCLVGAGPGDPGLLTLKGAARLAQADVVLYDGLVNPEILRLARPGAELTAVGKRAGEQGSGQGDINRALVELARSGKRVVRLKGGDPYIFGRGGEEASVLADAGIPFEVVCGVTAASAAAAYAGVPLTHRAFGSTLVWVTGHEDPTKSESQIDYSALARMGTVVIYMGVQTLAENCRRLVEAGMPPETPVAVVRWASRPEQRSVVGTLRDIAERTQQAGITPPALALIGQVVSLRDKLNWFEHLSLFGRRVVITRPADQAGPLAAQLAALGATVIAAPAIRIEPLADYAAVDRALANVSRYAWLVLTSVNGVEALCERMRLLGMDARRLAGIRLAAIGEPTADALRRRFLSVDCVPPAFTSQALAEAIAQGEKLGGKRVLLLRADIASPELPAALTQAGAICDDVHIYRTVKPDTVPQEVVDHLRAGRIDWITFTSSSTVNNLLDLLAAQNVDLAGNRPRLASIGPVTTQALNARGLAPAVEAQPHTVAALVKAIAAGASPPSNPGA